MAREADATTATARSPSVRTVAVTGATGHLGLNLLHELCATPDSIREIRILVRRDLAKRELQRQRDAIAVGAGQSAPSVVPVRVDLASFAEVVAAVRGCDAMLSCAGNISFGGGNDDALSHVNVTMPVNVARACAEVGVPRMVHVASIEAFPLTAGPYPITESREIRPESTVLAYGRSKAEAILELRQLADETGLALTTLCPTGFIGPNDYRRSPMGRMIHDFIHGRLPAYVPGGFDFVDVRDVARAVRLALAPNAAGETYIIGGAYVEVPKLMMLLEEITGVHRPSFCVSDRLLRPLLPAVEAYYRITRLSPRFTRDTLSLLSLGASVSSAKAERDLGYRARPIAATIRDTVAWQRRFLDGRQPDAES